VGYVGLAGAPNVGKSTLVNRIVGQKICVVSDRPQTTRARTLGILTDARMQAIFVDIPGILTPRDRFNEALMECAADGLRRCDLVLHLRDARRREGRRGAAIDDPVIEMIRRGGRPVWLVWNKVDRVAGKLWTVDPTEGPRANGEDSEKLGSSAGACHPLTYRRVFGLSAKTGRGVQRLLDALAESLPAGELRYDPDQLCDRDLRFLAAELVREKLLRYLGAEIPYATATLTETFDEHRGEKVYIRIVILTERAAHKPIIIGHKGAMLQKIGQAARLDLERMLDRPVFLELWVKVWPHWRRSPSRLVELGLGGQDSG
jgi:GTP-binding protein Era